MIYASDANLLAKKRNNCIFAYSYSVEISQWQNSTKFESLIDDKIKNSSNLSLILHLVLIAIIIALIIPLFCLLRRRAHEHTVVFDILASVEANMTSK
jgi:subtilase family serine protease